MTSKALFDFAVITIFARETLEGGIIIGEYRTVIKRSNWENAPITKKRALREVTVSALLAALVALVICAAIAIPLAILSLDFQPSTAKIIEGVSKIVAAICLLQLSLKMPKFFGLYYSKAQVRKIRNNEPLDETMDSQGISVRSIRFNVAWNIWREVAECGVFLIPFFLTGEGIIAIPLSAVVGVVVGGVVCVLIYYANHKFKSTKALTMFTVGLFILLSTGLFTGGCHNFEKVYGSTPIVYEIKGDFMSVERLPMTIFKPFGYSDTRTVLQVCCFWVWMAFSLLLHFVKYKKCAKPPSAFSTATIVEGAENLTEEKAQDDVDDYLSAHEETREPSDSDSGGGSNADIEAGKNADTGSEPAGTIEICEA
jgi:high-affinity iron transporter